MAILMSLIGLMILVFAYGCCRMAGDYDAQMEKWEKTPFEREVEQVMRDTGMEKMQAVYHVRARNLLRASSAPSIGPRMKPQHDIPPAP